MHVYTLASDNPDNYGHIDGNIQTNFSVQRVQVSMTNFITYCNYIVLEPSDFIEYTINSVVYVFHPDESYSNMDLPTLINLLQLPGGIVASATGVSILNWHAAEPFEIVSMSYNLELLTGNYGSKFPLQSVEEDEEHVIRGNTVGWMLLTPILYIESSLGSTTHQERTGFSVFARINNTFSTSIPIVAGFSEYTNVVTPNALTQFNMTLVDANRKPVFLLNPMYVTISIEPIPDPQLDEWIVRSVQRISLNRVREAGRPDHPGDDDAPKREWPSASNRPSGERSKKRK